MVIKRGIEIPTYTLRFPFGSFHTVEKSHSLFFKAPIHLKEQYEDK